MSWPPSRSARLRAADRGEHDVRFRVGPSRRNRSFIARLPIHAAADGSQSQARGRAFRFAHDQEAARRHPIDDSAEHHVGALNLQVDDRVTAENETPRAVRQPSRSVSHAPLRTAPDGHGDLPSRCRPVEVFRPEVGNPCPSARRARRFPWRRRPPRRPGNPSRPGAFARAGRTPPERWRRWIRRRQPLARRRASRTGQTIPNSRH